MNKNERLLLKHLAETHAFIYDLRQLAISRVDAVYIRKTSGIEETIDTYKSKYPRVYTRFFKQAVKKASEDVNGKKTNMEGRKESKKEEAPQQTKDRKSKKELE